MFDYSDLYAVLHENAMTGFSDRLARDLEDYFDNNKHGDLPEWLDALEQLPAINPSVVRLDADAIQIGAVADCDDATRKVIRTQLMRLLPWRKGPFNWFGVLVDSEWRSDLKWKRFQQSGVSIRNHLVLDIGAGNGYYGWRMAGEGADAVIGIDPTLLYVIQFQAARKYLPDYRIQVLPFGVEHLPDNGLAFDSVFSMGVIYHRKDPVAHIKSLFSFLREGGQLVLETLIIDNGKDELLKPEGRYAKMNNVHGIPSINLLQCWLNDTGFINTEVIDVTVTTPVEQRKTEWMQFESLEDFLDPDDQGMTIEGYPAPARAMMVALKP